MRTRVHIVQSIITALRRIDGRDSPWNRNYTFNTNLHSEVYFGFKEDPNSFPTISLLVEEESVYSIGGGERFSNLNIQLRCYTYNEEVEESAEALVEDVEQVINAYRLWSTDIQDFRIAQIETDGGINAPYGAAIITAQVLFRR